MFTVVRIPLIALLSVIEIIVKICVKFFTFVVGVLILVLFLCGIIALINQNWIGLGILFLVACSVMIMLYTSASIIAFLDWIKDQII